MELSALDADAQRQLTAFLVSLDARDDAYCKQLAEKIDKPAAEFVTLEDCECRLGLSGDETETRALAARVAFPFFFPWRPSCCKQIAAFLQNSGLPFAL
jgi:hypothetical protein